MDYNQAALQMHEEHHGKVAVQSKVKVENRDDLSTAYTPGVAEPCRRIHADPRDVYRYTAKGNLVAPRLWRLPALPTTWAIHHSAIRASATLIFSSQRLGRAL